MKMNKLEKLLVNTPGRLVLQRLVPTPFFLSQRQLPAQPDCLEIGCGQGAGVEIILEKFKARRVIAFDYDPEQVRLAKQRIHPNYRGYFNLCVADAASLCFPSARFDAVFNYAILHHVAGWREALAEIYRMLKPGGQFFYEELLRPVLDVPIFARLFEHPPAARFTQAEFEQALIQLGFKVGHSRQYLRSYLLGVAQKPCGCKVATFD